MFSLEDIPPPQGLKQLRGKNETLTSLHNPNTGWPIRTYGLPAHIWLQDDLTFRDGKVLELEKYKEHYLEDIEQVIFYVWHKNISEIYPELNFVYYPRFHYEQRRGLYKESDIPSKFTFNEDKDFIFLCLNMNRRLHRDKTVKLLEHMPSRLISYKAFGWNIYDHPDDWTTQDYNNRSGAWGNAQNLLQLQPVYNRCEFSVVTETRYDLPYDFITEKTTQCFVSLHPALYVSNRGHVQEIRNMGFDVFDDVFDHSYDTVDDDNRIDYLVNTNRTVLEQGIPNYGDLKDRLLANRRHYLDPSCPLYEVK
tara:strand:+ start:3872 stop:4795 length:924 start_codon:yes stop_codon:yes gene_type:complete